MAPTMKTFAIVALILLAGAPHQGEAVKSRSLLCKVVAKAVSISKSDFAYVAKSSFKSAFEYAYGCGEVCAKADASITVIAHALATAIVKTEVFVDDGCGHHSFGKAHGSAIAFAKAVAKGYAEAIAEVTNYHETATSIASAGAIETKVATAYANASSYVKGPGYDSAYAVSEAVAKAVVELVVEALAAIDGCGHHLSCCGYTYFSYNCH